VGEALSAPPFWSIGESAARCGTYCWLESRLFELMGARASDPSSVGPPELRVLFSEMSFRHASLAAQWHDRLPVRAGVDRDALVLPPPGGADEAFALLAGQPDIVLVLGGLVGEVLPRLRATYDQHLAQASPVSEGPVREVLDLAIIGGEREIRRGRELLLRHGGTAASGGLAGAAGGAEEAAELGFGLQRLLGGHSGVFPAARAS
jgi:hypothetical protein